jgi:hypothetical protein
MDDLMNLDLDGGSLPAPSPNKKTRSSRAQQVVNQSIKREATQGNLENLPSTRLERGIDNGNPTLTAIFVKAGGGKPDRIDLSFLLDFPGLTDSFAEGFLKWFKPLKQITRVTSLGQLRTHWFTYLAEQGLTKIDITKLDEQIIVGYNTWLHHRRKADGKPLHPKTIGQTLSSLRSCLSTIPQGRTLAEMVPLGPPGAGRKTEATSVLTLHELLSVMAAVEKEILALRDRWAKGRQLLELGRQRLLDGAVLERNPKESEKARSEENLALALAMLDQLYPGMLPGLDAIYSDNRLLSNTVNSAFTHGLVASYLYSTNRDLVPLALSIALATAFNANTVLTLQWKNIDRKIDRLSNSGRAVKFEVKDYEHDYNDGGEDIPEDTSPLTKITGDKPRARYQIVRLLDPEASGPNQVSLNLVLDLLLDLTARIRPLVVQEDHKDRIFIAAPKQQMSKFPPRGFGREDRAAGDTNWQDALGYFIRDNHLPAFSLKTIRATLMDYVQLLNRGDLQAARQVGNHASRVTTWTHYTSNLVKQLLQESTGETMLVRERWLQSSGKMDPRKFREWTDKGCATPGWMCLDPFDSPRSNQKKDRLCTAYGECPDCPLAAARIDNPHNVMLYEALRHAIYRSATSMTASMWQERWAQVVTALDALLAQVPVRLLDESRQIVVELPNVG